MPSDLPVKGKVDCSETIRGIGCVAAWTNAIAAFGILLVDYQSGGHGEMGSFYQSETIWILLFTGWGVATGIGLLRAWRWARISALIFSGLLVAFGILVIAGLLRLHGGGISDWGAIIARAVLGLLSLIPIGVGARFLIFFTRTEVKTYFQASRAGRRGDRA